MKKVFLLLSLVLSVYSIKAQQIKISQLPTMIGDPSGGYVPIVKGGLTQKIDARFLGYNRIDSVSISIGSGVDTFNYWKNGLIVFSNTYSPSGGGGGGGGALSTLSDVTITSLSNNQALVFNSGKWRNTILTTTIVNEGTNQYWTNGRFDTRFATKTTDSLTQGTTNKYYSNSLARTALSVSNPVLTYNNTTGVFGIQQATGTQSGYLTAIDWNNFNTKFNTPTGTASQYIRGDGVLATFPTLTTTLSALNDVNVAFVADGQLLKFNNSTGKWSNFTPNYLTGITSSTVISALGYTPFNANGLVTQYVRGNGTFATTDTSMIPNFSTKVRGLITAGSGINITNGIISNTITDLGQLINSPGYITGISGSQVINALGYTPANNATTLTINGVSFDLSQNRSWTIAGAFAALTDVNLTSTTDGQLIKYNSSSGKWINFTPNYLTNINTSQVTTALGFTPVNPNGTNLQYIKGDGTFGSFMFNNLTDITVSSPSNNQLMRYNTGTSKWVNFTPNYFSPPDTLTYLATKTNIVKDTVIGFQIGDGGTFTPSNGTTTYSNPLLVAAQIVNVFKGDTVLPTFAVTGGGPYVSFDNTTGILTLHNTTFKTGQAVTVQYAFGSGVVPGGGGGGGGAVSSVFGRTGAIVAQLGDYSSFYYQIPTGTTGQYIRGDGSFATFPTLATVATTGNYTDLTNKPIIPTNNNQLTNGAGYLTGITGSQVITALGYTPFNPTGNTSQYVRGDGTLATSDTTMIPSFFAKVRSEFSAGSGISIANGIISNTITNTNQLTNGAGFLTSINSSQITTALGYTPANNATTITINGTVFDLSANRTYNLAVSNLTDVNITTITDGQLLKWNNSTSKWVNFTPNYLTSVDTTNISNFSVKVRSLFSAGSGISISGGVITNLITNTNQLTNGAGFITGNQTITLSSDITGSGTTAITATIGNNKVTYAKFQQVGALKMLGNTTGSTANVGEIGLGTGLNFSGGNLINTITNTNQLVNGAGFYAPTDTVNTLATKWFVTHNPDTLHVFGYGTGVRAISTSLAGDTLKFKTFVNSATTVWSYNSDSSLTVSCIMTPTQSLQATSTINWSLVGDQTTPPDNAVYGKIGGSKGWFPLAQFPITSGTTNGLFDWHEKNKIDSIITVINAGSTFDSTLYSAPTLDTLFAKRWNFVAGINMIISNTGSTQALNQYTISADTTSGTGKLATQGYVTRTEGQPITPTTLTDGATITWNTNNGRNASITLGGTGRTLTITNPVAGTRYTLKIVQDATGGRTITTWPSGTKWVGGTAPTLTSSANGIDIISLYYDGTNYFGSAQLAFN